MKKRTTGGRHTFLARILPDSLWRHKNTVPPEPLPISAIGWSKVFDRVTEDFEEVEEETFAGWLSVSSSNSASIWELLGAFEVLLTKTGKTNRGFDFEVSTTMPGGDTLSQSYPLCTTAFGIHSFLWEMLSKGSTFQDANIASLLSDLFL
ncbi:hypothetical protein HK096_006414 [Nowakowskiella sp. JEL0078]|nr:hypothetical protein HK096_006414 [Nowakowskiella sp. JEL0078]